MSIILQNKLFAKLEWAIISYALLISVKLEWTNARGPTKLGMSKVGLAFILFFECDSLLK